MISYTLYQNTSHSPHLKRTLTALSTGDIPESVIEKMNITEPVFILKNDMFPAFAGANYLYLGAPFNRYYFLGSAEAGADGLTRIPAHVDVLYTYKAVILNSNVIAKRSSSHYNRAIDDPMTQHEKGFVYNFTKFNYTFNPEAGEYILQTGGR